MKTYLYRFCSYILLSMFLALALGPFADPYAEPHQDHLAYGSHSNKQEMAQNSSAEPAMSSDMNVQQDFKTITQKLDKQRMARKSLIEQARSLDMHIQPDINTVLQKPQIKFSRYILAIVFLLSGIVLLRKAYKTRPGIAINPRWAAVTADISVILFLGFAAYCVIAYGLEKFTGANPYLYDPTATGMITLAYVPVVAFLSYFATNCSGQSIEICDDGITTHYPEAVLFVSWRDIQGFDLKEIDVWVTRLGMPIPTLRKVQTKLILHTSNGDLELFEPGLKRTKSLIINGLRINAPDSLQADIAQLEKGW